MVLGTNNLSSRADVISKAKDLKTPPNRTTKSAFHISLACKNNSEVCPPPYHCLHSSLDP